jgi:hypothetical protein
LQEAETPMNKKQLRAVYMAVLTGILVGGMIVANTYYDIPILKEYPYIFAIAFLVIARLAAQYLVRNKADDE